VKTLSICLLSMALGVAHCSAEQPSRVAVPPGVSAPLGITGPLDAVPDIPANAGRALEGRAWQSDLAKYELRFVGRLEGGVAIDDLETGAISGSGR
jgi:hypothetical protein